MTFILTREKLGSFVLRHSPENYYGSVFVLIFLFVLQGKIISQSAVKNARNFKLSGSSQITQGDTEEVNTISEILKIKMFILTEGKVHLS